MSLGNEMILITVGNILLAVLSTKKKAFTTDGVVAAFILGMITGFVGGGKSWVVLVLFLFFVSLAEHLVKKKKGYEYHECRNALQVSAIAIIYLISIFLAFYIDENQRIVSHTILATSMCDTVASTIGKSFGNKPIDILTGRTVPNGLSGGITMIGTGAGIIATFIYSIAVVFLDSPFNIGKIYHFYIVFLISIFGMFFDSILGSVFQTKYLCPVCHVVQDNRFCHTYCKQINRVGIMSNTAVNFLTNIAVFILASLVISIV